MLFHPRRSRTSSSDAGEFPKVEGRGCEVLDSTRPEENVTGKIWTTSSSSRSITNGAVTVFSFS